MDDKGVMPVPFRFRLGEVTLCSVSRQMRVINLADEVEPSDEATLDLALLDTTPNANGILYRVAPIDRTLPKLSRHGGALRYVPSQFDRYLIHLTGDFETYLSKFSSKTRSTLRRKVRKFEKASGGEIDWRVYRSGEELIEFHTLACDVSARTYQQKLFGMGLPTSDAFIRSMRARAEQDRVRGYLIFMDDRPVAYLYCPIDAGRVQYAYLGYLEEYAAHSPGTVLLYLALESLFKEGKHRLFDFTEGGLAGGRGQKGTFSTHSQQCADIYLMRPSLSNLILVGAHTCTGWLSGAIGETLARFGLKKKVKRWVRRFSTANAAPR